MKILGIPFVESSYISPLIADYLNQDPRLQFCSSAFPTLENLCNQAKAKQKNYPSDHRRVLVQSLEKQYKEISTTSVVRDNIALLGQAHTVTVTTGHQLNLMTGPLYFIYKIITTIKLAQQLNAQG
ncbi:MAG: bacillithiol biosynthesis BshC, partial [Flavobacteriaceae bacterium]